MKNASPVTETSAIDGFNHTTAIHPKAKRLPPRRCQRLLMALMAGAVTREEADSIAPASNAPHYIGILRHKFGLEIPCERVPFVTKDGAASWYGRYHTTPADRPQIAELLKQMRGQA